MREVSLRFLWAVIAIWLSLTSVGQAQHGELHWYKGNTHTHTINSDGDSSPDVVARWYREHDYQFLFITDHEYLTDPAPFNALFGAKERFLLLPGQEITQSTDDPKRSSAHINALFTHEVIFPMGIRRCIGSCCRPEGDEQSGL